MHPLVISESREKLTVHLPDEHAKYNSKSTYVTAAILIGSQEKRFLKYREKMEDRLGPKINKDVLKLGRRLME